jgi:hypothetical protein
MNPAPRTAVLLSPRATRTRVARAGRPRVRARASARAPGRVLASVLLGALAGLAAGAAFVAGAPAVGRTVAAGAEPMLARAGGAGQARGEAASSVSAVLAPAIDAGVVWAPDAESARP